MEHAGIDLFEAMSTLQASRRLRPDPVPKALLHKVLTAATWAPSGGNRQPWRFIAVEDKALKTKFKDMYLPHWRGYETAGRPAAEALEEPARSRALRMYDSARHLAEHFDEAPVIVVVCVHLPSLAITDLKLDRPPVVGGASIYPAVQNLMLACRAVGLGATLTTLLCRNEPEIKQMLAMPDDFGTAAFIPIGYPTGKGYGRISRKPVEDVSFGDRWGKKLF